MSLVEADDVPDARSFCSISRTRSPRPAASRAIPVPLMPPPTMARSKSAIPADSFRRGPGAWRDWVYRLKIVDAWRDLASVEPWAMMRAHLQATGEADGLSRSPCRRYRRHRGAPHGDGLPADP